MMKFSLHNRLFFYFIFFHCNWHLSLFIIFNLLWNNWFKWTQTWGKKKQESSFNWLLSLSLSFNLEVRHGCQWLPVPKIYSLIGWIFQRSSCQKPHSPWKCCIEWMRIWWFSTKFVFLLLIRNPKMACFFRHINMK